MFFLNLTAAEFLTLMGGLGSLIAALYLLDRAKRKKVVSTLRFWTPAETARENQRRRRVRDPWSLVLQLASLTLLLLAVAQLQWGSRERRGRDYVLLLDTSAWAGQRDGDVTLLDRERRAAERYLDTLAPRDRVMLVRADALAAPLTPFTTERVQTLTALRHVAAGFSALNIEQALSYAKQAQSWSGGEPGEVVYIGPRMVSEADVPAARATNLRVITVEHGREHVGIRGVGVVRTPGGENAWQAAVTVKNYGAKRATVRLRSKFAGSVFAPRVISLEAGAETAVEYDFVTNTAGQFVAGIITGADGMGDGRVALELPPMGKLRVAVFTDRPQAFRPLFGANTRLSVRFFAASGNQVDPSADLIVLDRASRAVPRNVASIWVDPPREVSPLPVKTVLRNATIRNWHSETALGESLHAKDTPIPDAEVFQTFDGDITIGSVAEGPLVVARAASESGGKIAVIGFDPLSGDARLELTTPLLFANLLRWMSPDVFRSVDFAAERVGAVSVPLDPRERTDRIRVRGQRGMSVPFVIAKQAVELFRSTPEVLRVTSEGRETVLSVTVPDVAAFEWKPPAVASTGVPARSRFSPGAWDLWRGLAVLGALGLFAEWMLFGHRRVFKRPTVDGRALRRPLDQQERELVSK